MFQFHKGSIKTTSAPKRKHKFVSFNSIKVRLRLHQESLSESTLRFQFHKGSIKTIPNTQHQWQNPKFQFHKGSIKTTLQDAWVFRLTQFQFHKGSIKTY